MKPWTTAERPRRTFCIEPLGRSLLLSDALSEAMVEEPLELALFIEMGARVSDSLVSSLKSMLGDDNVLDVAIVASKTDLIARLKGSPEELGMVVFDIMTGRIGDKPGPDYKPAYPTTVNPYLLTPIQTGDSLPFTGARPGPASCPRVEAYVTINIKEPHPHRPANREVRASPLERGIMDHARFPFLARVENRQRLLGKIVAEDVGELRKMLIDNVQAIGDVLSTETYLILPSPSDQPKAARKNNRTVIKRDETNSVLFLVEVGAKDEGDFVHAMKTTIKSHTDENPRKALPPVELICGQTDAVAFVQGTNSVLGKLMVHLIQRPLETSKGVRLRAVRTYLLDVVKHYEKSERPREFEAYVEIEVASEEGVKKVASMLTDDLSASVDFVSVVKNRPHTIIARVGTRKKRDFDRVLLGDIQRHPEVVTTKTLPVLAEEPLGYADRYGEARRRVLRAFRAENGKILDKPLSRRELLCRARAGYKGERRSIDSAIDRLVDAGLLRKLFSPVRLTLTAKGEKALRQAEPARAQRI